MYIFNMPEIISGENTDWYVCTFTQTYGAINCILYVHTQEYTDMCTSIHFHETCSDVHVHKCVLVYDVCVYAKVLYTVIHTYEYIHTYVRSCEYIYMNVRTMYMCSCKYCGVSLQ